MKVPVFAALVLAALPAASGAKLPPLKDPVFLNIGFVCKWQTACIEKQQAAMKRALGYIRKFDPPTWKVEQCNRNASRQSHRVDWIGFNHCIRNSRLRSTTSSRHR